MGTPLAIWTEEGKHNWQGRQSIAKALYESFRGRIIFTETDKIPTACIKAADSEEFLLILLFC